MKNLKRKVQEAIANGDADYDPTDMEQLPEEKDRLVTRFKKRSLKESKKLDNCDPGRNVKQHQPGKGGKSRKRNQKSHVASDDPLPSTSRAVDGNVTSAPPAKKTKSAVAAQKSSVTPSPPPPPPTPLHQTSNVNHEQVTVVEQVVDLCMLEGGGSGAIPSEILDGSLAGDESEAGGGQNAGCGPNEQNLQPLLNLHEAHAEKPGTTHQQPYEHTAAETSPSTFDYSDPQDYGFVGSSGSNPSDETGSRVLRQISSPAQGPLAHSKTLAWLDSTEAEEAGEKLLHGSEMGRKKFIKTLKRSGNYSFFPSLMLINCILYSLRSSLCEFYIPSKYLEACL